MTEPTQDNQHPRGPTTSVGYTDPFTVGPMVRIPGFSLVVSAWVACGAVGLAGWVIAGQVRPAPGVGLSVWLGAGAVAGAFLIATVAIMPWKPRRLGRITVVWLGGRLVCMAAVLVMGALLYFAPPSRPDPLAMGLTLGSAYFAAVVAESAVMARRLRGASGART